MAEKKNSADYQRAFRQRLRELGLVQKTVYILPEHAAALRRLELAMQSSGPLNLSPSFQGDPMGTIPHWTTQSLFEALQKSDIVLTGAASIEFVEGAEPALSLELADYGDMAIQIAVAGGQIFVSTPMWTRSEVKDTAVFDELALRLNPLNPLSNMGITRINGVDWYVMFGELSAHSLIEHVVEEIETLADNTLQAAEAFRDQLKI